MRAIAELVEMIDEELDGAKCYAEKALYLKSDNDPYSVKFRDMANAELQHSLTIHDYAMQKINQLKQVYEAPVEMQDMWDKSHKEYVEKTAWIKQMLSM